MFSSFKRFDEHLLSLVRQREVIICLIIIRIATRNYCSSVGVSTSCFANNSQLNLFVRPSASLTVQNKRDRERDPFHSVPLTQNPARKISDASRVTHSLLLNVYCVSFYFMKLEIDYEKV